MSMKETSMKVILLVGPTDVGNAEVEKFNLEYLGQLEEKMGQKFKVVLPEEVGEDELPIFFIATGGSEEAFQEIYEKFSAPYLLLTTDAYNSLAASMEIMGYLEMNNHKGEILHGCMDEIVKRIDVLQRIYKAKKSLKNKRLGAIGKPSGLISSEADVEVLKKVSGIEIVNIDLNELIKEYSACEPIENEYTREIMAKGYREDEIEKALKVYAAVKKLIEKYNLQAVTIKCFDLIPVLKTTGCLALAILNAEGIPSACEGDTKSLISMTVLNELTGEPVFMANPSFMDTKCNEMIIAHCTLPINMPKDYYLTTHFESGIGVAIAGNVEKGSVTVFKCDESFKRFYAGEAELLECLHRDDLCRTQMRIKFNDGIDYFLKNPISNHHLICKGAWKEVIEEFFA